MKRSLAQNLPAEASAKVRKTRAEEVVIRPAKHTERLFLLSDIDPAELDHRYGIVMRSNIGKHISPPLRSTKITDLSPTTTADTISFFDEAKNKHKCCVSMIDFSSNVRPSAECYCFWDKNPLPKDTTPIGCPVRYVSKQASKKYLSEISKDTYTIIENVTKTRAKRLAASEQAPRITLNNDSYYETDGVFCSWNCAMAFAEDNKANPLYRMSILLLLKMYNDFNETSNTTITPAPSWRLLRCFGGTQTIEEFRANFSKVDYDNYGLVKSFRPMAMLFEEKLRF